MLPKYFFKSSHDDIDIEPFSTVTRKRFPKYVEISSMSRQNKTIKIKKLDKDRYLNLMTGEIGYFEHTENRAQSLDYLAQSIKKIKDLINYNFQGTENEKWVTLSYKDGVKNPMRDVKKLYKDVSLFMKRLQYFYKDFGKLEYINCIEPQGTGSFHCHILVKFEKEIYFNKPDLEKIWGHGWAYAKQKKDVRNLGGYISAYLGNIRSNDKNKYLLKKKGIKNIEFTTTEKEKKAYIKGGRLHFYPTGIQIFRKSKGIVYPPVDVVKKGDAIKQDNLKDAYYKSSYSIYDHKGNLITEKRVMQYQKDLK